MFPKDHFTLTEINALERALISGYRASVREAALQVIKAGEQKIYRNPDEAIRYLIKVGRSQRHFTPAHFWVFVEDVVRELRREDFEFDAPMSWRPHEGNVLEVRSQKLPHGGIPRHIGRGVRE